MDTYSHYEKYWKNKKEENSFFDYERNWVLPKLFNPGETVLDIGCGNGVVAEYLQKNTGVEVTGFELSEKAANEAIKKGVKVIVGNVEEELPFKKNSFDVVLWGDNIEHLFNPQKTLHQIYKVIKPGGRLIVSCPNMAYWRYRLHYFLTGELPDTEWTGNPPWYWSHIRFFSYRILKDLLNKESLKVKKIAGVNKRLGENLLAKVFPEYFAMIMVVEATK